MTMQSAEKVSITMTPEMMRVARESVDAGEYTSISEVFRAAMRAWQREREEHAARLDAIRARIQRSLDDPRPSMSMDEAEAQMASFMEDQEKAFAHAAG